MIEQYREITAKLCDQNPKMWFPDLIQFQMEKVWDVLFERGWRMDTINFHYEGEHDDCHIYLFHKRLGEEYEGVANDEPTAFMKAFMQVKQYFELNS